MPIVTTKFGPPMISSRRVQAWLVMARHDNLREGIRDALAGHSGLLARIKERKEGHYTVVYADRETWEAVLAHKRRNKKTEYAAKRLADAFDAFTAKRAGKAARPEPDRLPAKRRNGPVPIEPKQDTIEGFGAPPEPAQPEPEALREALEQPAPVALPAITPREWNGEPVQTVDAEEWHGWLGVKTYFTTWIDRQIEKYGFVEGRDYLVFKTENQVPHQGGLRTTTKTAYHLTIDMAKELAMVESNEKGKEARQYFIDCEKRLKAELLGKAKSEPKAKAAGSVPLAELPATFKGAFEALSAIVGLPRSQAILAADRTAAAMCGTSFLRLAGVAESVRAECQEPLLTPTEIGKVFQMTPRAVNLLLEKLGLQYLHRIGEDKQWALTTHGMDLGGEVQVVNVEGKKTTVTQIKWARSILQYLEDRMAGAME